MEKIDTDHCKSDTKDVVYTFLDVQTVTKLP